MAKKFDLDSLAENHEAVKTMRETMQSATRQQIPYVNIEKVTKKAGILVRNVQFTFEEAQSVLMTVRGDGAVIQVKLNSKVLPMAKVMDCNDMKAMVPALEDIALKVKSGQEKFSIKLQTAKVQIPRNRGTALTVKKRIQQTRMYLAELADQLKQEKDNLASSKEKLNTLQTVHSGGNQ